MGFGQNLGWEMGFFSPPPSLSGPSIKKKQLKQFLVEFRKTKTKSQQMQTS